MDELPLPEPGNNEVLTLVYTARFAPGKGHDRLIPILKHINRPYKLRLIGDGTKFEQVKLEFKKANLSEYVEFLGLQIPPYPTMKSCDIYIQPSHVEGFPNALMEAAAIGLSLLAYDVPGGTKEIINDINGQLIENGDALSFAEAINSFDSNNYTSKNIRADIRDRFDVKTIAKKYIQIESD